MKFIVRDAIIFSLVILVSLGSVVHLDMLGVLTGVVFIALSAPFYQSLVGALIGERRKAVWFLLYAPIKTALLCLVLMQAVHGHVEFVMSFLGGIVITLASLAARVIIGRPE